MEGAMDVTREQAMDQGESDASGSNRRSNGCYKQWIRKQAMDPGAIEGAVFVYN